MSGDHFNIQNNVRTGEINQVFGDVSGASASVGGRRKGPNSLAIAIDDLIAAVAPLRPRLAEEENRILDGAIEGLDPNGGAVELGGPLRKIAEIAAYVGEFGAPVVKAVRAVQSALQGGA